MGEFQITCKVHDDNEVITQVGIQGKRYSVKTVVDWINNKEHSFFTLEKGERAKVYTRQHSTSKRWYLVSSPDGVKFNNLDYLPTCK